MLQLLFFSQFDPAATLLAFINCLPLCHLNDNSLHTYRDQNISDDTSDKEKDSMPTAQGLYAE